MKKLVLTFLCAVFVTVISAFFTQNVSAATISVDGTACTLQDAILATNTDLDSGTCTVADGDVVGSYGNDTILLLNDITLTAIYSGTNGLPPINDSDSTLSIQSNVPGTQRTITRSSGSNFRIFQISGGRGVTFTDLIISNGRTTTTGASGSGIFNSSTLTLNNVTVTGNSTTSSGTPLAPIVGGGGIANSGTLTVRNSRIENNSATRYGGAILHTGTLLTVENSLIDNNQATFTGAALYVYSGSGGRTTNISGSTISNNTGPTAFASRHLSDSITLNITLDTTTIEDNTGVFYFEDAIVTITDSSILNNTESSLGNAVAGFSFIHSTATIDNSLFADNTSTAANGVAGIALYAATDVDITNSTFSGNAASSSTGHAGIALVNSSVHAGIPAIQNLYLLHSTITKNTGKYAGIILEGTPDAVSDIELHYNIIAENSTSSSSATKNCALNFAGHPSDLNFSSSYNIIGDTNPSNTLESCVNYFDNATDITDVLDAGLESLADNGGPTETHALEATSIAIDFAVGSTTSQDQRGSTRAQDGNGDLVFTSDSGSYELGTIVPPVVSTVDTNCTGVGCTVSLIRFGCKDPHADPFLSVNFLTPRNPQYPFYFHHPPFCAYTYFGFDIEPVPDPEELPPVLPETPLEDPVADPGIPSDENSCPVFNFKTVIKPHTALHSEQKNEVTVWQIFLRTQLQDLALPITGIYDAATINAVKSFQRMFEKVILVPWTLPPSKISYEKTKMGTGYIYKTTRGVANYLMGCTTDESVFIEDTGKTINIYDEMRKLYPETLPLPIQISEPATTTTTTTTSVYPETIPFGRPRR